MSLTPDEFLADVAAIYIGDKGKGAFGSGRLIAPGLVLTAGHVVDYPTREAPTRAGWKVCLIRERTKSGAWKNSPNEAELLWRGPGDVDLALLRVIGEVSPALKPVFATFDQLGSIAEVDASGFPEAWFGETGTLRDYTVRGSLRIAEQLGPYAWTVPPADNPDDRRGWKGMSGAALCHIGSDDKVYLLGAVQEVPANFSDGLLRAARLSHGFADTAFCEHLHAALGEAPRIIAAPGARAGPVARALAPSEQAPPDYVDRPEITGPLVAHLLDRGPAAEGRAMISALYGLGGIGKTTVAQWIIWRPEVEERFPDGRIWVTLGREPLDALTIINDRLSQLDPAVKAKATVETARDDLAALLRDRSVFLVIDDVWPGKSAEVAKALMVPSPRSRFLLTTRFPHLADDPTIRARGFALDEMSFDQARQLMVRSLGHALAAAECRFAKKLWEIVGGHPLALELAAARIKEEQPWEALLDDLATEINRLDALEDPSDDLIAIRISDEGKKKQRSVRASLLLSVRHLSAAGQRLFALLGVAAEDALITPRVAATFWSTDEGRARGYLNTLSGAGLLKRLGDSYRIHDLMLYLARELLTAPANPARDGDVPGLGLALPDARRQLLERYRLQTSNGLWHTVPDDGYIHDHLIQHLEQAGWESEARKLLWEESADGHCGWYSVRERSGQSAGFLADVYQILNHAERSMAAPTVEQRAGALALQLHSGLIIASINSLASGMPVQLLASLLRSSQIEVPAALTLARRHPDPGCRVSALLALYEFTGAEEQSLFAEAWRIAQGIPVARSRGRAMAAVARWLPAQEALKVARGIDDLESRIQALTEVGHRLAPEEHPGIVFESLSAARDIGNEASRARALAEVAQRLPPEQQPAVFAEALLLARGINDASQRAVRAVTLAEVAERLPPTEQPSVLDEALETASQVFRMPLLGWALAEVAKRLPTERALAVADGIDDPVSRVRALADIAKRLPTEERRRVLGEALSEMHLIGDAASRVEALTEVALQLPANEQRDVLAEALHTARAIADGKACAGALAVIARGLPPAEALEVARGIDNPESRARALAETAMRLPSGEQAKVLGEALTAARQVDDIVAQFRMVTEVAQRLPGPEALAIVRSFEYTPWRAEALVKVIGALPADEASSGVLVEALSVARGVNEADQRARALADIAQRLPAQEQPNVLAEALTVARACKDAWNRGRALAYVAERLPPEEALEVARGIDDAGRRAGALAEVALRLAPEEALKVARGIDDVWRRAQALAAVAQRLPAREQPNVLGEALTVARAIENAWTRKWTLAEVAHWLPPEEALEVARSTDDAALRAPALAKVAKRLPADEQPSVYGEALSAACGVDSPGGQRAGVLEKIAQRLSTTPISDISAYRWTDTIRALSMHKRSECVEDLAALLPFIDAIGGETAVRGLKCSIATVRSWWP